MQMVVSFTALIETLDIQHNKKHQVAWHIMHMCQATLQSLRSRHRPAFSSFSLPYLALLCQHS